VCALCGVHCAERREKDLDRREGRPLIRRSAREGKGDHASRVGESWRATLLSVAK